MNRYLLDSNIVIFMLLGEFDEIDKNTRFILEDARNLFYVSSISLIEIQQLYRIKKIKTKKYKSLSAIIKAIKEEFKLNIKPFAKEHCKTLTQLKPAKNNNDPFDHSIVAHAITEKLTLISSDHVFKNYTKQSLDQSRSPNFLAFFFSSLSVIKTSKKCCAAISLSDFS